MCVYKQVPWKNIYCCCCSSITCLSDFFVNGRITEVSRETDVSDRLFAFHLCFPPFYRLHILQTFVLPPALPVHAACPPPVPVIWYSSTYVPTQGFVCACTNKCHGKTYIVVDVLQLHVFPISLLMGG